MSECSHDRLTFGVSTYRFEDSPARCVKLDGRCQKCGVMIEFVGMSCDDPSDTKPGVTRDARTARIPFRIGASQ